MVNTVAQRDIQFVTLANSFWDDLWSGIKGVASDAWDGVKMVGGGLVSSAVHGLLA
jgi:hypothetical protein